MIRKELRTEVECGNNETFPAQVCSCCIFEEFYIASRRQSKQWQSTVPVQVEAVKCGVGKHLVQHLVLNSWSQARGITQSTWQKQTVGIKAYELEYFGLQVRTQTNI